MKTPDAKHFPIGKPLLNSTPPEFPAHKTLIGQYCRLEPLNPESNIDELFETFSQSHDNTDWIYLPYGPFGNCDDFRQWVLNLVSNKDPQFYTIRKNDGTLSGMASYLRIFPNDFSIEVGHIHYAPALQKNIAGTETMYLMMKNVFDMGYRRYEWKCDSLNARSMKAARRLGFQFEGIFRQATVYKNRNRDTAWFSVIDSEWNEVRRAFEIWLSPDNFKHQTQIKSLTEIRQEVLSS